MHHNLNKLDFKLKNINYSKPFHDLVVTNIATFVSSIETIVMLLYFFKAPPPAALEFLTKIREVIATAKLKLATKRFTPNLLNIPEEENCFPVETSRDLAITVSRNSSIVSLKRENSRKKSACMGCPGCQINTDNFGIKITEIPSLLKCQTCVLTSSDSKQNSIRKWLENVPVLKDRNDPEFLRSNSSSNRKRLRSPTKMKPVEARFQTQRSVDRAYSKSNKQLFEENIYDTVSEKKDPPSDISCGVDSQKYIDTTTIKQMNAVINEFTEHVSNGAPEVLKDVENDPEFLVEYDIDSLERKKGKMSVFHELTITFFEVTYFYETNLHLFNRNYITFNTYFQEFSLQSMPKYYLLSQALA